MCTIKGAYLHSYQRLVLYFPTAGHHFNSTRRHRNKTMTRNNEEEREKDSGTERQSRTERNRKGNRTIEARGRRHRRKSMQRAALAACIRGEQSKAESRSHSQQSLSGSRAVHTGSHSIAQMPRCDADVVCLECSALLNSCECRPV